MKWKDEIVEEVRRARDEYAAQFDYDIAAICADIRKRQHLNERHVVTNAPENYGKPTQPQFDYKRT